MQVYQSIFATCAITGAGVVTGLLFAFSNFVMKALSELPGEHGMFAMQRANEKIINPVFLLFFLGTPVSCCLTLISCLPAFAGPGEMLLAAGAICYLAGPLGITIIFNLPLNNRLAQKSAAESASAWPAYQKSWQFWNHIRSYTGILSILLLTAGLAQI